jgi:hypothetical protein
MLNKEFDGRCAYCGQQTAMQEVEHLLPRSQFPFDSYFNILPACNTCNSQKGARTPFAARMSIHQDAYQAYSDYVGRLKTPHLFHTIKKGMLKLMARAGSSAEVEKELGMLADNLVTITTTQKGPRPLARFLASRLERLTQKPCKASWTSGRHTALYRSILLPEYHKDERKEQGDLVNHAVDAIILGCDLPSATAIENPRWYARTQDLLAWREKVQKNAPTLANGLPEVEPIELISFFEEAIGNGYCTIDLSAFNWNRSRQSGHKLDPVGVTTGGYSIKREPATEVLTNLKDSGSRGDQIKQIAHPALRARLEADPAHAPERLVRWLQQTVKAGLAAGRMGNHPSDQARQQLLTEFVESPVEAYLADDPEKRKDIPRTIGIRCLGVRAAALFDVSRCDDAGRVYQHYKSDPHFRAIYIGYRMRHGSLDRSKPVQLCVNQVYTVTQRNSSGEMPLGVEASSPLHGRPLGSKGSMKAFLATWRKAFDEFCQAAGIVKRFLIAQGCVIEKTDGTRIQLRNFASDKPWAKGSPFRDIRRVYRSPFCFLNSLLDNQ